MKNHLFTIAWGYIMLALLYACDKPVCPATYYIDGNDNLALYLENWFVAGPFTQRQDSMIMYEFVTNGKYPQSTDNPDTTVKLWHYGTYHPLYGQLDLREVFNIEVNDTTRVLDCLVTYLSCTITSERERDLFLHITTEMKSKEFLNGDSLTRIDIKGMNIYPVHLKQGDNTLFVRTQGDKRKYWYEAKLYDSTSVARLYAEEHTGNIIQPVITGDTITLTDKHYAITESPIKIMLHDVNGNKAEETVLKKGIMNYHVSGLEENHAYICSMIVAGDTVKQPVMTYAIDDVEAKFRAMRDSLPDDNPRAYEIDQLLYRVWKLCSITGKMREDAWFPFKFPWIVYQLEHTFANINGTYGNDSDEYNFKFVTYRSQLDGCLQRYLLVTPNSVDRNRKYPLVVVMRPCSANRYHLFFSPQISHQFVVNDMQAVANKYGVFVIMPEARMMLDEDMIPFAEAEMRLALDDVQEHYNIDPDRIFLHVNCSGGYRALRFATYNPDLFAGIALYAPVYRRTDEKKVYEAGAPETMLENLSHIPMLIYGDPADTHSPVSVYANLVKDCKKHGVPYLLTLRRNSGQGYHGYHRVLVGREACEFFKDKRKEQKTYRKYKQHPKDTTVADFYSQPFIYVYNASDTSTVYRNLVNDIRKEYETYLYSILPTDKDTTCRMPLIPDTRVTRRMLTENNVFLIGENFECHNVKEFVKEVKKNKSQNNSESYITLTANSNPYCQKGMTLIYTSKNGSHFKHLISYPWKQGFRRIMTEEINK